MESSRDRQKAQRRSDILAAAAVQFAAKGYPGTTISGIAAEMGAPKSAVGYHQFESKGDIAITIVESQRARWMRLIDDVTSGPGTGLEQLLTILLTAALDARENVMAAAAVRLQFEQQSIDVELPPGSFRWRTVGSDLVARSLLEGDIVSDRTADDIVSLILTASYGLFSAENNGFEAPRTASNLHRLWFDLLVVLGVPDPADLLARVRPVDMVVEAPAEEKTTASRIIPE